jgi:UDP-N-acetylmuramyl tripeptide synthase
VYSALLDKIHGYPCDKIFKIAVCGDRSRSLTALTLYATLRELGHRCLYIGRNGIAADRSSFVKEAAGIARIRALLHSAVAAGIKYAIIECKTPSELVGIHFDLAVCPDNAANDTPEAISYKHLIALSDISEDGVSLYLKDGVYPHCKIEADGMMLDITAPGKTAAISAAATLKAAAFIGCDRNRTAKALENAFCFGQREIVRCGRAVIIDHAYEAEQLETLLSELKGYSAERIICVFGAVGGRCEYRRAALGRTACRHCDVCIITSDDPEHEDQGRIARHILTNADTDRCRVIIENDRKTAIETALSISSPSDIIVIAGKGHERTNSEKSVISPLDEKEIVLKYAQKYIL